MATLRRPLPLPQLRRTFRTAQPARFGQDGLTRLVSVKSVDEFERYVKADGPRGFVSGFEDPYLNLALENYIFRNMPESPSGSKKEQQLGGNPLDFTEFFDAEAEPPKITNNNRLLLYVNKACVVVGRNQNPWRECNLPLVSSLGVPLLRRRSGGGTVVHDAGNVNFSVMTSREAFTRDKHAKMIVSAINELPPQVQKHIKSEHEDTDYGDLGPGNMDMPAGMDIPTGGIQTPFGVGMSDMPAGELLVACDGPQIKLAVNARYDIVQDTTGEDGHAGPKVSGSAYKIERNRAYHHGTMLLNARLDVLRALLHRDEELLGTVRGRGVESVKSPVVNIGMDKDVFISTVLEAFALEYCDVDYVQQIAEAREIAAADDFVNPLTVGIDDYEDPAEMNKQASKVAVISDEKALPVLLVQPEYIPKEIYEAAKESMTWNWKFGQTPEFTHRLQFPGGWPITLPPPTDVQPLDLAVTFKVNKGRLLDFEVQPDDAEPEFQFLRRMIELEEGKQSATAGVKYIGKEVAGYIPNDEVARWVSEAIDGSVVQ